ncbi:MAG: GTP-binding protein [Lachnospiraceae bacterium]|nr:GTP-binding protein [Lachnospiraceae bacterium]
MTKIDIISGFLGAGKTTLIKKLIKEVFEGQKIVLIENEFGEIGIDGGFLKEAGINVTEMNSGCICCSLVGDFGKALSEVLKTYAPDRVIIEPSGVGKLSDVIKAVQGVESDVEIELNSFTAVVDANKCKMYMKNFGEFFNNQIESAKTIILSRTQNISDEKLETVLNMIKEHNDKAVIVTTPWDDIEGAAILNAMEQKNTFEEELLKSHHEDHHHHHEHDENCECGCHDHDHEHHHDHDHEHHDHDHDHDHDHHHHEHDENCECGCHNHDHDHHHHHHADEVFTSWGKETPRKYTKEELEAAVSKLANGEEYGIILRAKGILPAAEGEWFHFDLVPGEYEIRRGAADYTGRLCVIGTNLNEDELQKLFLL